MTDHNPQPLQFPQFYMADSRDGWKRYVYLRVDHHQGLRIYAEQVMNLPLEYLARVQIDPELTGPRPHEREAVDPSVPARPSLPIDSAGKDHQENFLAEGLRVIAAYHKAGPRHGEAKDEAWPIDAPSLLNQAAKLIADRAPERDSADGQRTMAGTVAAFNAIHGTALTEAQGWQFMELLKMSRSRTGRLQMDDYTDGAAYAALAGEAAAFAALAGKAAARAEAGPCHGEAKGEAGTS